MDSQNLTSTSARSAGTSGSISLFALVIILCMAVLSVLTVSTAHSSLVLSQRQAEATQELYLDEAAAQTFLAGVDGALGSGGAGAVEGQLASLCADAAHAANGEVQVTARMEGQELRAEFASGNGRILKVSLALDQGGTYRVDSWRMTAVVNEEQPMGTLYLGD